MVPSNQEHDIFNPGFLTVGTFVVAACDERCRWDFAVAQWSVGETEGGGGGEKKGC